MSRSTLPGTFVGNDFIVAAPRLRVATPLPAPEPVISIPVRQQIISTPIDVTLPAKTVQQASLLQRSIDFLHQYSIGTFALLFLLVAATGIQVGGSYWAARTINNELPVNAPRALAPAISGLNVTVPTDQLAAKLQAITSQAATIKVGDQNETIPADTIKSWLQITASKDKTQQYIRIKSDAIAASLSDIANKYVKNPVNQVTATYADGTSAVIATGKNGTKLHDPNDLKLQAAAIAKTVMDAKGLSFNAPLDTQAFAAVTPAAFAKLIEVNLVTKQMYLYDNGQVTHTYPISAGAPETPSPIGQYKIYSKLPVQDMKGYNPNGTKYFQPHVRWINYFLPGGYAVHGNYWRPTSWFGVINSSHGCVSLPDDQAKEVYDWAPLGTTVITHN